MPCTGQCLRPHLDPSWSKMQEYSKVGLMSYHMLCGVHSHACKCAMCSLDISPEAVCSRSGWLQSFLRAVMMPNTPSGGSPLPAIRLATDLLRKICWYTCTCPTQHSRWIAQPCSLLDTRLANDVPAHAGKLAPVQQSSFWHSVLSPVVLHQGGH